MFDRFGIAPSAEQLQATRARTRFHYSRLPEIAAQLSPAYRALERLRLGLQTARVCCRPFDDWLYAPCVRCSWRHLDTIAALISRS